MKRGKAFMVCGMGGCSVVLDFFACISTIIAVYRFSISWILRFIASAFLLQLAVATCSKQTLTRFGINAKSVQLIELHAFAYCFFTCLPFGITSLPQSRRIRPHSERIFSYWYAPRHYSHLLLLVGQNLLGHHHLAP